MMNARSILALPVLLAALACSVPSSQAATADTPSGQFTPTPSTPADDARMAAKLPGLWKAEAQGITVYCDYFADYRFSCTIEQASQKNTEQGTWRFERGDFILTTTQVSDLDQARLGVERAKVLFINDREFQFSAQVQGEAFTVSMLRVSAAGTASAVPPVTQQPGTVAAQKPQTDTTTKDSLSYSFYIPQEGLESFSFTLNGRQNVALALVIDNTVPLDVLVFPGKITKQQYNHLVMTVGLEEGQDAMEEILGKGARLTPKDPNVPRADDLFSLPLSKKGAYVNWQSEWQVLDAGTYTVFLDNSGNFSPSRGDAPVQVGVYSAPLE